MQTDAWLSPFSCRTLADVPVSEALLRPQCKLVFAGAARESERAEEGRAWGEGGLGRGRRADRENGPSLTRPRPSASARQLRHRREMSLSSATVTAPLCSRRASPTEADHRQTLIASRVQKKKKGKKEKEAAEGGRKAEPTSSVGHRALIETWTRVFTSP